MIFGTTTQAIAHFAQAMPASVAIVTKNQSLTFGALALDVARFIVALTVEGVAPGQVAGVEIADPYLHIAILLACEAMGVTTISLLPSDLEAGAQHAVPYDIWLVSEPLPNGHAGRVLLAIPSWIEKALTIVPTQRDEDRLRAAPVQSMIVRLIRSSGTTGIPHVMTMTNEVQQRTFENNLLHAERHIGPRPNFLCLYHLSLRGAHSRTLMTLQRGGTVHLAAMADAYSEMFSNRIDYALLGAGDLERIVGALPPGATPPPIHIDVIGAAISPELRAAAERKLARSMVVTYGTNEVHHVSLVDRNQVGTLFPGVRIRIADDRGNERPPGESGFIHIQTATMTAGYMGSHDADNSALRDGWYRSRDIGYQPSQDRLVVLGRTDNVMNVGGVKIDPGPIEAAIKKIAGVSDALVTVLRDEIASGILLVAVETNPDRPPPGLRRAIIHLIGPRLGFHRVLLLAAFPRTELGKVRRSDIVAIAAVRFRAAGENDPLSLRQH